VTELAVIAVTPEGLVLREVAPGVTTADVQKVTEAKLILDENLKTISL
jgi:acyl CoA:acetate/3-ketoacid CoA transferase beta subunit